MLEPRGRVDGRGQGVMERCSNQLKGIYSGRLIVAGRGQGSKREGYGERVSNQLRGSGL